MCLIWKFDNGKMVSIANEQTESQTESCQHPVPCYNIDLVDLINYPINKIQVYNLKNQVPSIFFLKNPR